MKKDLTYRHPLLVASDSKSKLVQIALLLIQVRCSSVDNSKAKITKEYLIVAEGRFFGKDERLSDERRPCL